MIFLRQNVRHVFGRVARRVTSSDGNRSKFEFVAILHRLVFEAVARAAFMAHENFRRFDTTAKFTRTADQICVNVRFENVRDRNVLLARQINVNIDIGARIENGGNSFFVVTDEIRNFSQPFRFDRFKTSAIIFADYITQRFPNQSEGGATCRRDSLVAPRSS